MQEQRDADCFSMGQRTSLYVYEYGPQETV